MLQKAVTAITGIVLGKCISFSIYLILYTASQPLIIGILISINIQLKPIQVY